MRRRSRNLIILLLTLAAVAPFNSGCQEAPTEDAASLQKPPKPVSTMTLRRSSPSVLRHTSATVAPWKAERIGFEQEGRVVEVIEPNEMVITGTSPGHNGTVLARLDDERLRIVRKTIEADTEVAQRRLETNRVAIEQRLPAGIESAAAQLRLAENELERSRKISGAISRSELDTIQTRASTARLQVTSAKAELAQAKAEQLALAAQVRQAKQRMAEAERDLRNSTLYSSFSGQVAEIHAVPGTYAKAGDPIVTVLMMDPMLVEFEVTAETSRRYQRGDTLDLSVADKNGKQRALTGMVYTVDSVADEATRTFTVSLHVRNQKVCSIETGSETPVARTQSVAPLDLGPMVAGDNRLLVDQTAIHRIDGEAFVWKITNRTSDQASTGGDHLFTVKRLAVKTIGEVIPFLGKWNFVSIEFKDQSDVDLERDLITGELYFDETTPDVPSLEDWIGNQVLLEDSQWMLRAGDVARVALLPENSSEGFYVPMKAIRRENGQTFVHVIETSQPETQVRRIPVNVANRASAADDSIRLLIEAISPETLTNGMQIVVGGTHFLRDNDRVRIVPATESGR